MTVNAGDDDDDDVAVSDDEVDAVRKSTQRCAARGPQDNLIGERVTFDISQSRVNGS